MSNARKHHYLPQSYLKSFALPSSRKHQLHVIDVLQSKKFVNAIDDIAVERDFNRFDNEHSDPNILEKSLSKIESIIAPSIKNVIYQRSLSNEKDLAALLNLMAILAARNPRNRLAINNFMKDIVRVTSEVMISSKDRWKSVTLSASSALSRENVEPIEYEEMKEFIQNGQYEIEINKKFTLGMEAQLIDPIIKTFAARNWCLLFADEQDGEFITTDHPVSLVDLSGRPPNIYGVGYGLSKTAVIFPLSRNIAMLGTFEPQAATRKLDYFSVAEMNTLLISVCKSRVYSGSGSFYFRLGNEFLDGDDLLKLKVNN